MKITYTKTFYKDIKGLKDERISKQLIDLIEEMKYVKDVYKMTNFKKMEGYKNYFRKKIGNYRLGFKLENGNIKLIRFKHRKDIYKAFP